MINKLQLNDGKTDRCFELMNRCLLPHHIFVKLSLPGTTHIQIRIDNVPSNTSARNLGIVRGHMGPGNYGFFPVHYLPTFLASLFAFYKGKMI